MASLRNLTWETVFALMIFMLLLAGAIPSLFVHIQGEEVSTLEQNEGDTTTLKEPLHATVNHISNNQINVTLFDAETGETVNTGPLNVSESTEIQLEDNDISVTFAESIGPNTAVIVYEYPVFYQWDSLLVSFIGLIAVIILALFLLIFVVFLEPEGVNS